MRCSQICRACCFARGRIKASGVPSSHSLPFRSGETAGQKGRAWSSCRRSMAAATAWAGARAALAGFLSSNQQSEHVKRRP